MSRIIQPKNLFSHFLPYKSTHCLSLYFDPTLHHQPTNHTMAPTALPESFYPTFHIATLIQKRSSSCEVSYSSQCTTHRTILLIVSIFVGSFLFIGFALSCIIKRGRNKAIERAQSTNRYPPRELRLLTDEAGFPVVARVPLARPMRNENLSRVEPTWKMDAGDERCAKRDEAPPPYTPRTPEPARMRI